MNAADFVGIALRYDTDIYFTNIAFSDYQNIRAKAGIFTSNVTATEFIFGSTGSKVSTIGSYLSLVSNGNEIVIGGGASMHINYRASSVTTAIDYIWHAGTGTSYATHTMGSLTVNGTITSNSQITGGNLVATGSVLVANADSYGDLLVALASNMGDNALNLNAYGEWGRVMIGSDNQGNPSDLFVCGSVYATSIAVTSATKVTNLNSDKVDGMDIWTGTAAAYTALGTGLPSTTLYFITA